MLKLIDYYFTPISPYTYLGHERFVEIAARHGATVAVKPCLAAISRKRSCPR